MPFHRLLLAVALLVTPCLSACSTPILAPREPRPVDVLYRFDNVRRSAGLDEWTFIRDILQAHASGALAVQASNERKYDRVEMRDYSARLVLHDAADIRQIEDQLDRLSVEQIAGERTQFALVGANLHFRSNYITAALDIVLRGNSTPGATVKIYLDPGSDPVIVKANQYGAWAKQIKIPPDRRYVYGSSEDAASGLKRYFRIDAHTQQQEPLSEEQFKLRQ